MYVVMLFTCCSEKEGSTVCLAAIVQDSLNFGEALNSVHSI